MKWFSSGLCLEFVFCDGSCRPEKDGIVIFTMMHFFNFAPFFAFLLTTIITAAPVAEESSKLLLKPLFLVGEQQMQREETVPVWRKSLYCNIAFTHVCLFQSMNRQRQLSLLLN